MRDVESTTEEKLGADPAVPRVRPVVPDDVTSVCRLLEQGFAGSGVSVADWRRLFDCEWLDETWNRGVVLEVENEIVGFLGTIYARRQDIAGPGRVCNLSSWYVQPPYRGWGLDLLAAAVDDRSVTYTSFTAGPAAQRWFTRLRFRKMNAARLAMLPLLNAETLQVRGRPALHFEPDAVRGFLNGAQQRVFDDHAPHGCLQFVVSDGPDHAYIVVKRRVLRRQPSRRRPFPVRLPYSEILHCSAPDLLARHLERVKLAVLRRQRTIALVADSRMWAAPPRGLPVGALGSWYRSPQLAACEIDKLYSELVLLPI